MKSFLRSTYFKIGLGILVFILLFLAVFPVFFQEKLKVELEKVLQQQVQGDLRFDKVNLSFFRHFPALTLSLDKLYLGGSLPFENDTLLYAKEMAFGVGISSLFSDRIKINEIYLDQATVKILRDVRGNSNFDVFPTADSDTVTVDSSSFELEIESFFFQKSRFVYKDTSLDMICEANGVDYRGSGNLVDGQFNLQSNIQIGEFQLVYDELPIFNRNRLSADLLTRINTETTALTFERNALKINDLPLNFVGAFEFIPGGYDMNFILESFDANLKDILSLVPPEFMPGFEQTKFGGKGDIVGSFQGFYLPDEDQFPGLVLNLSLKDGMIAHSDTSPGVEHLTARINFRVPELDPNQVSLEIDSLGFNLGDGFLRGALHLENLNPMRLDSELEAKIDLGQLHAALGMTGLDYRGMLELAFRSEGNYRFMPDPNELRESAPIIQAIPAFSFSANLKDGFVQWAGLPEPIKDIQLSLTADTPDSLLQHINFELKTLHFQVLDQVTDGFFKYWGRENHRVDANLQSDFSLADIPKFYPLDSGYQLSGKLHLDLLANGNYLPENKITPIINANLTLSEGYVLTPHYPEAIQDISFLLSVANTTSSFADFKLDLQPVSFKFAGNPFLLKANLANLDDIQYDLQSEGTLDLGKLYQVFGVEGMDIEGQILTDLSLKGRQSDATAGRVQQLNNSGTLTMEKIKVRSDLFPEPVNLDAGILTFNQDKVEFVDFHFSYLANEVIASGQLTNYLGYLADENQILHGSVTLSSHFINLDDFMFFGEEDPVKVDTLGVVTGVIVPPSQLDLKIAASVDSIRYGEYRISEFKGEVSTAPREIQLIQTRFQLVGAQVETSGSYRAPTPFSANFDYQVSARDFDILRAYEEIPIFKEMVSFAEFAEGKASLDYKLSGRLDANMYPVLPSIKGGGTLGLKSVKLKGFKLMNTMAEKTENAELNDPELNDIEISSSIENNLITIPRTKMKIAGFRPRLEGQVSLDGDLNIGIRLGLPPLGIFGIPVKVTGNAENFEMKVGKSTKEDNLEAEFDVEVTTQEPNSKTQND
ncbi:AsmA-like C-terminal region-containing protein [Algoriphagus terrigena]|uniref:AsmA family protein n=1 Tax=Algoriphagus terrigena TaxID=344884 RepID=UPI0003FACEE8|nr:AsmA-like C-terminal region-containing protein [Algoriphagus terrigena]